MANRLSQSLMFVIDSGQTLVSPQDWSLTNSGRRQNLFTFRPRIEGVDARFQESFLRCRLFAVVAAVYWKALGSRFKAVSDSISRFAQGR